MKKIIASIIIPTWNGKQFLPECLNSIKPQTFKSFEVIIVDNGSEDGTERFILDKYKWVKIIRLDKNYGFAYAINRGVRSSKGKYLVFLNNDTSVKKDWLNNLVLMAEKNPKIASINSKVLNYFNQKKIDGLGIQINEVGQANSVGWNETDNGQFNKPFYIFGATGGASLFNKSIFEKVGMFDENYFMYSEEVDWAYRAQFMGYKSMFCPDAVVFHRHKSSSKRKPQNLEYWQFKNMSQTIIKDMPTAVLLKNWRWLKILLVHFNTIIYQLKNGFIWPPIMTELWLFIHLPQLLIKRMKIQSTKKVSDDYIESFLIEKKITFWGFMK